MHDLIEEVMRVVAVKLVLEDLDVFAALPRFGARFDHVLELFAEEVLADEDGDDRDRALRVFSARR